MKAKVNKITQGLLMSLIAVIYIAAIFIVFGEQAPNSTMSFTTFIILKIFAIISILGCNYIVRFLWQNGYLPDF